METTTTEKLTTPEARDALRLQALPMVLAIVLTKTQESLEPEELIEHDELMEAVCEELGLELAESDKRLYDEINDLMIQWNWQWFTFNCGFQQYYARPEPRRANMISLAEKNFILQADQFFPTGVSDIFCALRETSCERPYRLGGGCDSDYCSSEALSEDARIGAFLTAHMIKPLDENGHS